MADLHSAHPDTKMLTPHELRHTRATLSANDSVDLLQLAKLLGHSDLNMLIKRYAHTDVEAVRRALKLTLRTNEFTTNLRHKKLF